MEDQLKNTTIVNQQEETVYLPATDSQIYQITSIVRKEKILRLIKGAVGLVLLLALLFIPFFKINLILEEVSISFFDMIIATSDAETLKGQTACLVMADFFNIEIEKYTNFFSAAVSVDYEFTSVLDYLMIWIKSIIPIGSIVVYCWGFIRYTIDIIFSIIPDQIALRLKAGAPKTFNQFFVISPETKERYPEKVKKFFKGDIPDFRVDVDHGLGIVSRIGIKGVISWLLVSALWGIMSFILPQKLCFYFTNDVLLSVSPVFMVLEVLYSLGTAILIFVYVMYCTKYTETLYVYKEFKKAVQPAQKRF